MVNLTEKELDFLIDLQHEMRTQDCNCQTQPVFWVVAQDEKEDAFPGYEDGVELVGEDGGVIATNLDDAVKYFSDYIENNINSSLSSKYIYELIKDEKYSTPNETVYVLYKRNRRDKESESNLINYIHDLGCLIDALDQFRIIDKEEFEIYTYKIEHKVKPDTLFFTNRGCDNHIRINRHHYNDTVHPYAMTAWRSPEVRQLFDILNKINWKELKEEKYKK